MMERRQFLHRSCVACAGLTGLSMLLQACGTALPLLKTETTANRFSIPVNRFDELKTDMIIVRPKGLGNDVLVLKKNNEYKALLMKCTHEGVGLTATKDRIYCSAHGSVFSLEGQVIKEPALRPLQQFPTTISNGNLTILINES